MPAPSPLARCASRRPPRPPGCRRGAQSHLVLVHGRSEARPRAGSV